MNTKKFAEEFKKFAVRGNMLDMAIGVAVGMAFTGVVNSIVADIIMPIVGLLTNNYNFSNLVIKFNENNTLTIGAFIQAIINFVIIALVLFFVVKFINKVSGKKEEEEKEKKPTELDLLTEIRDLLKEKNAD